MNAPPKLIGVIAGLATLTFLAEGAEAGRHYRRSCGGPQYSHRHAYPVAAPAYGYGYGYGYGYSAPVVYAPPAYYAPPPVYYAPRPAYYAYPEGNCYSRPYPRPYSRSWGVGFSSGDGYYGGGGFGFGVSYGR